MNYIEVIVPLPLNTEFTYSVTDEQRERIKVGSRVIVPFGLRKHYTAIVTSPVASKPEGYEVKPVTALLDDAPILLHPQLKFWHWMADYYMCAIGDVMRAALPAGLKVESETFVELNPDIDLADRQLTDEQAIVCQTLAHHGRLTTLELGKKAGLGNDAERTVSRLIDAGLLIVSERIVERYRTHHETMVALPDDSTDEGWLARAFEAVKGAPKQEKLLLAAMQLLKKETEVTRARLLELAGCTSAILTAVRDKGLLRVYQKEINRFRSDSLSPVAPLPQLTEAQQTAVNEIDRKWADGLSTVLLHGVTSSGKTEVYITLIDRALRHGGQTLMLVPEIALTTQLTERLQRVFGSKVVVYHSKFTDNERVDIWRRLLNDSSPCVVLGARSSIFLPFHRLNLVIIDEEHEQSYKQFDPAPRYNARDSAMVLASMHGAKVLLGSASPSVESYRKAADDGKFGLVKLTERFGGVQLPEIETVDMQREFKRQGGNHTLLADATVDAVESALADGSQAIIFHNRRGFAPMARCRECAYTAKCTDCDVSLTYHRSENKLICHYCGATYPLVTKCPVCQENAVEIVGYGTERVEERVQQRFPDGKILRMDLDTTRNKDGYQEIINNFSSRKSNILVGTQMVTKGLDFDGVDVVAVLSADMLIHYPDFRSAERAFNMMLQVAGRAGRRSKPGRVMVQTSEPDHPVIRFLKKHDYDGFYAHEIEERRRFLYPPFTRLIYIYLKHRDENAVALAADLYARRLTALLGNRVFGPEKPAVGRVQQLHIRKIMLKVETTASMAKVRQVLRDVQSQMATTQEFKGITMYYDVDPM